MLDKPKGRDRRRFGRRQMACHAYVKMDRKQPIHCMLIDLSQEGAQLHFSSEVPTASEFRLVVESMDLDVMCKVRHNKYGVVGVYFPAQKRQVEAKVPEQHGNKLARQLRETLVDEVA